MKNFFKSMWQRIKTSCKEDRRLILTIVSAFGSISISGCIAIFLTDNDVIKLLIIIPSFLVTMFLIRHYMDYVDATEYANEHEVSFETAFEHVTADDDVF